MVKIPDPQSNSNLQQNIDRVLETGQIDRREYFQLVTTFLSDLSVTDEGRRQINQVFDEQKMARIQLID
ncbi:hypothetical protein IQ249_15710 [Lusitaniella coriacea LEGE 07157]|uniref:Uncharacterized protein n=1 Tax=Lusitaniella coriacea LEGE 07157 TaxID=945747 RepID=A0A8J7JCC8_9CYAN|nr:hypothetical protein [Lusitaniella coriacea]MBE9117345.1 hypothetical protein [Lusitaniella coriacea LEGE 07157]